MEYLTANSFQFKARVYPSFIAPDGKYAWLNKNLSVGNLLMPVPSGYSMDKSEHENDRLIQLWRVH